MQELTGLGEKYYEEKVTPNLQYKVLKEVKSVICSSPRWKPGRQRDRVVPVKYTFL